MEVDGGILKPIGHSKCVPDHFYAFQACPGHILTTLGHVLDRVQVFGDSDFSSKSQKILRFRSKLPKIDNPTEGHL